jgi:hypothetical protein
MNSILATLWIAGAITLFIAYVGFQDNRKLDRRFESGYRDNALDRRNIPLAKKRAMAGAGICFIAFFVGKMLEPTSTAPAKEQQVSEQPPAVTPAAQPSVATSTAPTVMLTAPPPPSVVLAPPVLPANEPPVTEVSTPAPPSVPLSVAPRESTGGSYPCEQDDSYFGQAICRSDALMRQYGRVQEEYEAAQERLGGGDPGIRQEQEQWLARIKTQCADDICLLSAFSARALDLGGRYQKDN